MITASLSAIETPKVASTWSRWPRSYSGRMTASSIRLARIAMPIMAARKASRKDGVCEEAAAMKYPPSISIEPCARLMMFITPKASDTPIAIRNSTRPNWTPLNPCSSRSPAVTSFHRALGGEVVGAHLLDGARQLDVQAAVGTHVDHAGVGVLDRLVVMIELEGAAHALEIRFLERGAEGVLVPDVAFHLAHRGVEQHDRVVGHGGVARR